MLYDEWLDRHFTLSLLVTVQHICTAYNSTERLYELVEDDALYMRLFDPLCCADDYDKAEKILEAADMDAEEFIDRYGHALPESVQKAVAEEVDDRLYRLYKEYEEDCR